MGDILTVSIDTVRNGALYSNNNERTESEQEVKAYIQKLRYALSNGAGVYFVPDRGKDKTRDIRYHNRFTINTLFPDESPPEALKRELGKLEVSNYIRTLKDDKHPELDELREFGKRYDDEDVYIKIRVELVSASGNKSILVLSFHYAEYKFTEDDFPYKHD